MPKAFRIGLIVVAILVISGLTYLFLTGDAKAPEVTSTTTPSQTTTAPQPDTAMATSAEAGKYLPYQAQTLAQTSGTRILFFHAPWCPQCRQLENSIEAGTIPSGVTIFKVDYDSNQKLRQQYGVTIQTTLVLLDQNGNEVKKYVAYDQPNLQAVVQNLL